jgi:peptidoglycan/LPS O-acetylase OafA/YrhL
MFQHYFEVKNLDDPYWTMIVEMVFYIFILVLFKIKKLNYIVYIGLTIIIAILFCHSILGNNFPEFSKRIIFWFPLFNYFPLFIAGILFYKIVQKSGKIFLNYTLLGLCFLIQIKLYSIYYRPSDFINYSEYILMLGLYFLVFILFVTNKLQFIVCKPTLFLGKISFALYLIHQFISIDFLIPVIMRKIVSNFWFAASISFILVIALATLVTFLVEIPLGEKLNDTLRLRLSLDKKIE